MNFKNGKSEPILADKIDIESIVTIIFDSEFLNKHDSLVQNPNVTDNIRENEDLEEMKLKK